MIAIGSLLIAHPGYAVVDYTIGPNATPGLHTLTLTTVAGRATGTYTVDDAYPVLTSIPPGTFQAGITYSNVTINGQHLGTNCPTVSVSSTNGGSATFSVTPGQCTDIQVQGTLVAGSASPLPKYPLPVRRRTTS